MDEQLTYKILCDAWPLFWRGIDSKVESMPERARWNPEMAGCEVGYPGKGFPMYVLLVNLSIIEMAHDEWIQSERFMHMTYGITAGGNVEYVKASPNPSWDGAETAYMRLVQDWVNVVKQRLEARVSRRRIQARVAALKEELVAAVWAPARLAKRLEEGGWELVEAL